MNQLIMEKLKHEGAATIVTEGSDGVYVVATWNSYIWCEGSDAFILPAGGLGKTENNIKSGSKPTMLIGSKSVPGKSSSYIPNRMYRTVIVKNHS